jgi:probable addiction module antidote protein
MPTKTTPYDVADYLTSDDRVAAYIELAMEESDPKAIATTLGNVARARGMTKLAEDTGLTREALYRALAPEGNPTLATFAAVLDAMGLRMRVEQKST